MDSHFHLMFASYSPACAEADKTRNGNRNQSLCYTSAAQYKQVHWKCFAPEKTQRVLLRIKKYTRTGHEIWRQPWEKYGWPALWKSQQHQIRWLGRTIGYRISNLWEEHPDTFMVTGVHTNQAPPAGQAWVPKAKLLLSQPYFRKIIECLALT